MRTEVSQDWVIERLVDNFERAMQVRPVTDARGKPTGEYTYHGAVANRALELLGKHLGMFDRDNGVTINVRDDVPNYTDTERFQRFLWLATDGGTRPIGSGD